MNEQNILIVRCGEVALKGMNKPYFERMLVDRIRQNLKAFNGVDVRRHEGLIFVRAEKDLDLDAIIKEISKVFGVASISKAVEAPSELNAMGDEAVRYMMNLIEERGVKTFKVEGKRADKTFPVKSPEIGRIIGAKVLVGCKVLKVRHTGDRIPAGTKRLSAGDLPRKISRVESNGIGVLVSHLTNHGRNYMLIVNRDFQNKQRINLTMTADVVRLSSEGKRSTKSRTNINLEPGGYALFTWTE